MVYYYCLINKYCTVGNFRGSKFSWFGNPDDFVGLYFHGVSPLIT